MTEADGRDGFLRGFPAPVRHHTAAAVGRLGTARLRDLAGGRLSLGWVKPGTLTDALAAPAVALAASLTLVPARGLTADDFNALSAARLEHLTELRLCAYEFQLYRTDAEAVLRWAAGLDLPRLCRLALCAQQAGVEFVAALAASPAAARLTRLDLTRVHLTNDGLEALGRATLPRLREVQFAAGTMDDAGLAAFVGSPTAAALRSLDVRALWTDAGEVFFRALASYPTTARLRVLGIPPSSWLPAAGVRALQASPYLNRSVEVHCHPGDPDTAGVLKAAFGDRLRPTSAWQSVKPASARCRRGRP